MLASICSEGTNFTWYFWDTFTYELFFSEIFAEITNRIVDLCTGQNKIYYRVMKSCETSRSRVIAIPNAAISHLKYTHIAHTQWKLKLFIMWIWCVCVKKFHLKLSFSSCQKIVHFCYSTGIEHSDGLFSLRKNSWKNSTLTKSSRLLEKFVNVFRSTTWIGSFGTKKGT